MILMIFQLLSHKTIINQQLHKQIKIQVRNKAKNPLSRISKAESHWIQIKSKINHRMINQLSHNKKK